MRILTLIFVLIAIFSHFVSASFMELGTGARPLGMGGAFSAVADDANAALWNPAGLCQLSRFEFSSMAVKLYGLDVGSQFISLCSGNLWEGGAIGVSALILGESGLYNETSYVISISQDLTSLLKDKVPIAGGINIKRLRAGYSGYDKDDPLFADPNNIDGNINTVYGNTFDLGFIYQLNPKIKSAIVIQNILTPSLSIDEEDDGNSLSRIFRLGGAYTWYRNNGPEQICFAAEYFQQALSNDLTARALKLGSEIWWNVSTLDSQIALRVGTEIPSNKGTVFTLGGGYRCAINQIGLEIDYALCYSTTEHLGNVHHVSLAIAY